MHLTVDAALADKKLQITAYVARHLTLGDRQQSLAQEFQEVPCEVRIEELEKIGGGLIRL